MKHKAERLRKLTASLLSTLSLLVLLAGCATVKPGSLEEAKVLVKERTTQLVTFSEKVSSDMERLPPTTVQAMNTNLLTLLDNVVAYTKLVVEWEKTGDKPAGIDTANTKVEFGLSLLELQLNGEQLYDIGSKYNYDFSGYRLDKAP